MPCISCQEPPGKSTARHNLVVARTGSHNETFARRSLAGQPPSGAGGIRTHTGRILNPVPLPLGYGPEAISLPDERAFANSGWAADDSVQAPRSFRNLAT
jgi:hypothetical protein